MFFLLEKNYNTTNLTTHLVNKHMEINITRGDDSTIASAKKTSNLKQKLCSKFAPDDIQPANNKLAMEPLYNFFLLILLTSPFNNQTTNILLSLLNL
jgi:hypothetical protein